MAFDDKGWPVFPTRHGDPAGAAIENRMISKVGGPNTIRTEIQNLPDGEVMLRTRNGMPEFTRTSSYSVTSSTCSLEMDSGIVDVLSASKYLQGFTSSGIMRNTDYVTAHVGGGAAGNAIGCGKLKFPSFVGPIIPEGTKARAFRSDFYGATSYTDRKKVAVRVPPSIFTGRMRFYVQSLYGGTRKDLMLSDASEGVGRPKLGINLTALDELGSPQISLQTGDGIYFDTSTKQHFLIQLGTNAAYIAPLSGTICAETYRGRLLSSSSSLSQSDQERIESYILSNSFPDASQLQVVEFAETTLEAFGYGWHFNWTGDVCDIVDVQEASVSDSTGSTYGFSSTHYRLTFSVANGVFSVSRSIVSGPTEWSAPKNFNVIAYPDWLGELIKAGNLPSRVLNDARFASVYCFYDRDDLRLLTISTDKVTEDQNTRFSTPEYFGGADPSYPTLYLVDAESGESIVEKVSANAATRCVFSINGSTVGGDTKTATRSVTKADWVGKFPRSVCLGSGSDSSTSRVSRAAGATVVEYGFPTLSYSVNSYGQIYNVVPEYPNEFVMPTAGTVDITEYYRGGVWIQTYEYYTLVQSNPTLVVIPYNDAQAVFLSETVVSEKSGSRDIQYGSHPDDDKYDLSINFVGSSEWLRYGTFEKNTVASFPLSSPYAPIPGYVTTPIDETTTTKNNKVISSVGTYVVSVMPGEDGFYSVLGTVSQNYETNTSVNGAIISRPTGVESGASLFPNNMVFLGWC